MTSKDRPQPLPRPGFRLAWFQGVGRRLFVWIVVLSAVVTAALTGVRIWTAYRADLDSLDDRLAQIQRGSLDAITLSLWNFDDAQLRIQLEGLKQLPDVYAVEVREGQVDSQTVRQRVGGPYRDGMRIHLLPMRFTSEGGEQNIGQLRVEFDLQRVKDRAWAQARSTAILQGAQTFLVGLVLLWVVHGLVTRHLVALARVARAYDPRGRGMSFQVRPRPKSGRGDEIDQVITALEGMRANLERVYRDLADTNEALQRDIVARQEAEAKADRLAKHDPLTDLPNRRLLFERLSHELAVSERSKQHGALIFIDLDHFKTLNDARGHSVGDAVLLAVANRLVGLLRDVDCLARLGGDEFVALLPLLGEKPGAAAEHAQAAAERVRAALAQPFECVGQVFRLSASLGISMFPGDGNDAESLLKRADTAMYQAKAEGRNRLHFFQPGLLEAMEERHSLETELRGALADGTGLHLAFQPIVDTRGRLRGAEALSRWTHPARGPIPPQQFIDLCEETGLIIELGDWVLRQTLQQIHRWTEAGILPSDAYISVNISPRQFRQADFEAKLHDALTHFGVAPQQLALEITEGVVLGDIELAIERMNRLREQQLRFFIDDFGTGYSSLAYLKRLPMDGIKIDKGFVRDLETDPDDVAIVEAIIAIGQHFGLAVVAEGVENSAQAKFLADRECTYLQGYHFGKPLTAEAFAKAHLTGNLAL